MKPGPFDAVVIGAGANGLVAAARLGKAGLRVLLVERESSLGGQSRVVEFASGFRAAPLGVDPGWIPRPVLRGLGLGELERSRQEEFLTVAEGPGSFLSLSSSPSRAAETIRIRSATDAEKWPAFTARLRKLAGFLETIYQLPAPDVGATSARDLLTLLQLGVEFRSLGRTEMVEFLRMLPLSVWELLDDWFESAPLKAAVAAGGIQNHQQGPRSGGTGFVLLHHLVGAPEGRVRGRPPWRRGPEAFTQAAERAARQFGVEVRTGVAIARIQIRDEAATGVLLSTGEEIGAKAVVSTAGPARTVQELVDPVWLDPESLHAVRNIRHRGCTATVLYALEALPELTGLASPEQALAGTISLTSSLVALERSADAAKYGRVSERPHVEITVPTLHWPDLAVPGRHVLVARAQYAPYRLAGGEKWDANRTDALERSVTEAIESVAPCFSSRILHRVAWSPRDLESQFGLVEGAASQGELGLDQILFMRPVAGWGHRTPLRGLYLGGAGTHPGPGVLGGPGWLAAQQVLRDGPGAKP